MKRVMIHSVYDVKKIIDNIKDRNLEIAIFLLAIIIRIYYVITIIVNFGVQYGGDAVRYNDWANGILSQGLSYYANNLDKPYYWGYPTIIALSRLIFGRDEMLLYLNCFFSSVAVIFLYRTVRMVFKDKCVALTTGIIYAYFYECIRWDSSLYSDSVGLLMEIMCIYFYYKIKLGDEEKKSADLTRLIFCEIIFFLVRTTSFITIAALTVGLVNGMGRKKKTIVYVCFFGAFLCLLIFMLATSHGDHGLVSRAKYYIGLFEEGTIVFETNTFKYNIPESHLNKPIFAFDMLAIICIRVVFFWSMFFKTSPLAEKILRGAGFSFIYFFGIIGLIRILKIKLQEPRTLMYLIVLTNFVQACFEIDGSQRYRLPIVPWVISIAAFGVKTAYVFFHNRRSFEQQDE